MNDAATVGLTVTQALMIVGGIGTVLCAAIGTLFGYVIMSMKQQREDCLRRDEKTQGELAQMRGEDRTACLTIMQNAIGIIGNCTKLLLRLENRLDAQDEDTKQRRRREDESGMNPVRK